MNKVSGRVVSKESGLGIADLLVTVLDVPGDSIAARGTATKVRLGSSFTAADGTFEIAYPDGDLVRHGERARPHLELVVSPPEEMGAEEPARPLFVSPSARAHAGRDERYLVRLGAAELAKAGIRAPGTPGDETESAARVVARLLEADARLDTIDEGFRQLDKKRVGRVQENAARFRATVKPALGRSLSRAPTAQDHFVGPDESVVEKAESVIRQGVREIVNSVDPRVRAPIRGFVALTDAERDDAVAALDERGEVARGALQTILGRDLSSPTTSSLVREDPLAQLCRVRSAEEVDAAAWISGAPTGAESPPPETPGGDVGGSGVEVRSADDMSRFVARLMDTMTSPEERVLSGLEPRASGADVAENVQGLSFPPSPADVPAFHDFHSLQIAFEHVWQELLDERIVDLAEDAYHDIVELGGDPERAGSGRDPLRGLRDEGRAALTARRELRDHRAASLERDPRGEVTVRDTRGRVVVRDHRGDGVRPPPRPGDHAPGAPRVPPHPAERLPTLLAELEERMKEPYAFTVYAANRKERSVNFGTLVTYRQTWEPLAYQAGKLAKTITLAPKETQKYTKKISRHRKRAEKEVENHLRSRREEMTQTARAEQEILRKATTRTSFSLTAKDSVQVPAGEAGLGSERTATFEREASRTSEDVKRAFHEQVLKAVQEYKDEQTLEVSTEESEEVETTESGEITNPNDELAVTFLFYELQRRYRIFEHIHRVMPVVLVAQEVPRPDEIDAAWLVTHDWILRRVLLDDSFAPALSYLSQSVVGEEVALQEMRENVAQQRRIVDELRRELGAVRDRRVAYRSLVERSLVDKATASGSGGGLIPGLPDPLDLAHLAEESVSFIGDAVGAVGDFLFGGSGGEGQTRQDALKEAMQRAADEERDMLFRLEREVTALNAITEQYTKALAEHLNRRAQVARLRVHVKQNILYYMQAIWSHEPPDQRFFRLHDVRVPVLERSRDRLHLGDMVPDRGFLAARAEDTAAARGRPPRQLYPFEVRDELSPELRTTTLAQVADLDDFLGFKGNYMVFRLKRPNALTDMMMQPYVVAGFDALTDPDELGNWTLEEFSRYIHCLRSTLGQEAFEAVRPQLLQQYERLLASPRRNGDVVSLPTGSLFIEALPARHSLLEEFKARHRAVDVKRAQAEVRRAEMENVRLAARILAGEREDPNIEKKVIIEGGPSSLYVPADDT